MTTPPIALFISNHLAHPRHARRVDAVSALGFAPVVVGYMREAYSSSGMAGREGAFMLGRVDRGRYHRRLPIMWRDRRRIVELISRRSGPIALIWGFGLDQFLLGALVRRSNGLDSARAAKVVLELGDLRGRGSASRLSPSAFVNKSLERIAIAFADGVVVTSPGHERELGRTSREILVALNRLPGDWSRSRPAPLHESPSEPLRMGVIGFFRYPDVLSRLLDAVRATGGAWELHFHGDGDSDIVEWVRTVSAGSDHCHYHGPFRNPEDLAAMYSSVDAVWSVYDGRDVNVRLAVPNKLFEALWFGKPILLARDTIAAELAQELGGGVVEVDSGSARGIASVLDRLGPQEIAELARASAAVPPEHLRERNEDLVPFLRSIGALPREAEPAGTRGNEGRTR